MNISWSCGGPVQSILKTYGVLNSYLISSSNKWILYAAYGYIHDAPASHTYLLF